MSHKDRGEEWDKRVRAVGFALLRLERHAVGGQAEDVELTEVRFKLDADNRTSVLGILKGVRDGASLVGFVGGPDLTSTVLSAGKKLAAGAVRWREDRPWSRGE